MALLAMDYFVMHVKKHTPNTGCRVQFSEQPTPGTDTSKLGMSEWPPMAQ